ncbi:MAG: hypothetical protein QM489_01105 [Candidatus Izemoplasma sp.]
MNIKQFDEFLDTLDGSPDTEVVEEKVALFKKVPPPKSIKSLDNQDLMKMLGIPSTAYTHQSKWLSFDKAKGNHLFKLMTGYDRKKMMVISTVFVHLNQFGGISVLETGSQNFPHEAGERNNPAVKFYKSVKSQL